MERSDLLIYGLFIAGYLLFNFLMQRAAKRARQQRERAQQEQAQPDGVMTSADEPLDELWGRGSQQEEAHEHVVAVEPARKRVETLAGTAPTPRLSPKTLLRSRQSLRDAIVVMTVLGPCRALDPHDRG